MIGKTISHYRILEKLGEGGMGVVYKAEDTKLKRTVALKFLSSNLLGGEEKDRFFREAQAAAALNHPNIATIFEIDESESQPFIAMEFIEGQSLAEMVTSPLPLEKAIDYATQISAGLQAAHEKVIFHRDIKSANVMVTDKGQVKIMDFGLAKLTGRSKMTKLGATLGTAAYMSPEQARGEDTDNRADIWSLGVVLYEMISGQLPFKGEYEQAVIYSILNEEPEPLTALRTGVPMALESIVAKAMAKDPATRYQNVEEVPADLRAIDLQSMSRSKISTTVKPSADSKPAGGSRLPWVLFGGALLAALVLLGFLWQVTRPTPEPVTRFAIPLPEEHAVVYGDDWVQQAVSPDGRKIVYVTQTERGVSQLYLRDLEEIEPTPISGTEGGSDPFFSPDGQWIGFQGRGKLWKISLFGGKPLPLCDAVGGLPATWGEGTIIFTPEFNLGLWHVSEGGGEPKPLTEPDETKQEAGHRFPQVLPGGEHVLFTIKPPSSNFDEATIATVSLKTGAIKRLFTGGSFARYLPSGHLVYMLDQKLMASAFDLDRLEVVGTPVKLLESVTYDVNFGCPQLAFSSAGALVYLPQTRGQTNARLAWLDRNGEVSLVSKELGSVHSASLSPDGEWVALAVAQGAVMEKIAVLELKRQVLTHLTVDLAYQDRFPFWAPDGERVSFWSARPTGHALFWKRRDGTGEAEPLTLTGNPAGASWSPDGKLLVYTDAAPKTLNDIWLLNYPEQKAEVFWSTPFAEQQPSFSPDGRWIAYTSNESGLFEIYVRPFPAKEPMVSISNDGGRAPFWSRDGREFFYLSGRRLMVVPMQLEPSLRPEIPKVLFHLRPGIRLVKGMSKDGQRFLALQSEGEDERRFQHLVVVQNWFEEVKRKVAEGQ